MRQTDYFAVVVGAGPAGTSAAIQLAESDHKILLIDKAVFPRDKICGDGLTADALKLLDQLGIDVASIPTYRNIEELNIYSPSGRANQYALSERPLGAVVARRELDRVLLNRARDVGVQTSLGTAFEDVQPHEDYLEIQTSTHGHITAAYLVAADGMWSGVRKSFNKNGDHSHSKNGAKNKYPEKYLGDWHAFRQYYEGASEKVQSGMHVWFEADLLPGYMWAFPLADGNTNIGFGVSRATHKTGKLSQKFQELMERPHIRDIIGNKARPSENVKAWPIPANLGHVPLSGPRIFFTGDAAAMTDPLTGEGIGQAIGTGILAAQAAITYPEGGAAKEYEKAVLREYASDTRITKMMSRLLRTPLGARGAIRLSGVNPLMRRYFARWLMADYPRALAFTPRRWMRFLFRKKYLPAFVSPIRSKL